MQLSIYRADNLEKIDKAVVKIEGSFSYQLVSKKANYSIELPSGDYNISAEAYDRSGNLALYAKETARLGMENQRIDLVLKPKNDSFVYIALISVGIIVIAIGVKLFLKSEKKEQNIKPKKSGLDKDAKNVLKVLESFENRATQKELKETLNFTDAKLSLILSELEETGRIKKFKRGRGNIIRKL